MSDTPSGTQHTRRSVLGGGLAVITGLVVGPGERTEAASATGRGPIVSVQPDGPVNAQGGTAATLSWSAAADPAARYQVELNGKIVAADLADTSLKVSFGDGEVAFQEGRNTCRVSESGRWSEPVEFEVLPDGAIRVRRFDEEDDGPIRLTTDQAGAALVIGADYAFPGKRKGVALICRDPATTVAYRNHQHLASESCWLRLAVNPRAWSKQNAEIRLARIGSLDLGEAENLTLRTGRGLETANAFGTAAVERGAWTQVQLGVLPDGAIQLWTFDGRREHLVGEGRNPALAGRIKDVVSIGNNSPRSNATFEVWLDGFAVGETRLPWLRETAAFELPRPRALDPAAVPEVFSVVFGSCNVSSRLPYRGTALEAAAATEPDLFIHLGDYGYPDTGAYTQTTNGYLALWSDLTYEAALSKLFRKPWLYITSDHDLGANNVDSTSLRPFAAEAFSAWQSNDRSTDPDGRYGSVALHGGSILLVWLDGVAFRSPVSGSPQDTMLGGQQKQWLFDLLENSTAQLIIIASQTSLGHRSESTWSDYPNERTEVVRRCQRSGATVRWLTGDYHCARWAKMGNVVEWGAAPLAEAAQRCSAPYPTVDAASCMGSDFANRADVLANLTSDQVNALTSFGRVHIDARRKIATFEIRDSHGEVRVDPSGFRFEETLHYG